MTREESHPADDPRGLALDSVALAVAHLGGDLGTTLAVLAADTHALKLLEDCGGAGGWSLAASETGDGLPRQRLRWSRCPRGSDEPAGHMLMAWAPVPVVRALLATARKTAHDIDDPWRGEVVEATRDPRLSSEVETERMTALRELAEALTRERWRWTLARARAAHETTRAAHETTPSGPSGDPDRPSTPQGLHLENGKMAFRGKALLYGDGGTRRQPFGPRSDVGRLVLELAPGPAATPRTPNDPSSWGRASSAFESVDLETVGKGKTLRLRNAVTLSEELAKAASRKPAI